MGVVVDEAHPAGLAARLEAPGHAGEAGRRPRTASSKVAPTRSAVTVATAALRAMLAPMTGTEMFSQALSRLRHLERPPSRPAATPSIRRSHRRPSPPGQPRGTRPSSAATASSAPTPRPPGDPCRSGRRRPPAGEATVEIEMSGSTFGDHGHSGSRARNVPSLSSASITSHAPVSHTAFGAISLMSPPMRKLGAQPGLHPR